VLTPADDEPHERPAGAPSTWQENCFLLARDDERDACVYLHVERHREVVEVKAAIDVAGSTTWHESTDDWWYEVEAPYERTRCRWRGGGLALDLELRAHLPAVDHHEVLQALGLAGAERDHYEVAGRCAGRIEVDGAELAIDGLFVRDHTWGVREYHQFGASWWWPTCFDGGDAYAGGVAVDLGDRVVGYGLVADADGLAAATDVSVEVAGAAEPGGYTGTTIRYTPEGRGPVELTSTTRRHLTTTFPGFGVDRRWNEAYSTCRWDERHGFGTRELGC
jgi:hypothetical protein